MGLSLALIAALGMDALVGEPHRAHPLVLFGRCADRLEARLNRGRRVDGVFAVAGLIIAPVAIIGSIGLLLPGWTAWVWAGAWAMLALGRRSLAEHARAIARPLATGDLMSARRRVAGLVSRDTQTLDRAAIGCAVLESILENANDAIVATMIWFALGGWLAGPAGAASAVVVHRLANTLDAMWGYRTERYRAFGWAAARLDDLLNWLPARGLAWVFVVVGHSRSARTCWRDQAPRLDSPNAGVVMTAGAGALGLRLGGGALYHGVWRDRPRIGCGRPPVAADIERALRFVDHALLLIVLSITLVDAS